MMWLMLFFSFYFLNSKELYWMNWFLNLDETTNFMLSIIPLVFICISMFLFTFLNKKEQILYLFFFSVILGSTMLCLSSSSMFWFIMLLEMTVFPMTYLILSLSKDMDKMYSVFLMFFINMMGSIPFMIFTTKAWLSVKLDSSMMNLFSMNSFNEISIYFCFILILISKLPLVFFHFWLTKAHVSASGSCSMLLASLMLKLGSYGLYKFSLIFIFCSLFIMSSTISISLFSCLLFSILMTRMFDLKFLIACSSILHMALIYPLTGLYSSPAIMGSMYMMTGHGVVSYMLFFLVTILYELSYNRSFDHNKSSEALTKSFSMYLFLFVLLNLGVPPFINFYSELLFCLSLGVLSNISLWSFSASMVASIMFTMMFLTKMIFGKKNLIVNFNMEYSLNVTSWSFLIMLSSMPLIF